MAVPILWFRKGAMKVPVTMLRAPFGSKDAFKSAALNIVSKCVAQRLSLKSRYGDPIRVIVSLLMPTPTLSVMILSLTKHENPTRYLLKWRISWHYRGKLPLLYSNKRYIVYWCPLFASCSPTTRAGKVLDSSKCSTRIVYQNMIPLRYNWVYITILPDTTFGPVK